MATRDQYAIFKDIFDGETSRYQKLADRATFYLTIITLYLGLLAVAADRIVPQIRTSGIATAAYLASFAAFVLSLVLVVRSMAIHTYVYPTDPEKVLLATHPHWPTDSDFHRARMVELAAAFKTNHPINERRATMLRYASTAILAGIVLQAVVLCMLLLVI